MIDSIICARRRRPYSSLVNRHRHPLCRFSDIFSSAWIIEGRGAWYGFYEYKNRLADRDSEPPSPAPQFLASSREETALHTLPIFTKKMRCHSAVAVFALLFALPIIASPSSAQCSTAPFTHRSLRPIRTEDAVILSGPFSQGIISGDHLYVSGFLPLAPHTGEVVGDTVEEQTQAALDNIKAVIEAAGTQLGKVVKVTLYLKNIEDYGKVNKVYAEFFGTHRPARTAIAAANLLMDVLVEIDMMVRI
ncbi:hypothetical protein D9615_006845 [Tricholomella constricta]|uniref:RidA family protein n=1 Tax=Tricholomella constricta TaxID=117010 RepID=A0A8H5H8Y7_9AGAR|nr:hypothetical protein D9615_006845 [Tricholomella constricta]